MITGRHLLVWGDRRINDNHIALFTAPTAIQKFVTALKHVQLLNGSFFATVVSDSTYKFPLFGSTKVNACVPLPHVFLLEELILQLELIVMIVN